MESIPRPRCMGLFFLLVSFLALIAGQTRNELILTLLGVIFLTVLGYSFLGALILAVLVRRRARSVSVRIVSKHISAGREADFLFSRGFSVGTGAAEGGGTKGFFRLPGVLIRYRITLMTRDKRKIAHIFDPDTLREGFGSFPVPERGAYYSTYDEFMIPDALGFFQVSFHIPQDAEARLLAAPGAAALPIPVTIRSGGTEDRTEPHYLRTENLIDHRPYVPGDDPRRINWKLYGHAGDLFVREGEPEPPPHSRLLILVDTQTDPALYTSEEGWRGVDLLCENALAAVLEYSEREGAEVLIGYTGGGIRGGNAAELADVLAYPASLPFTPAGEAELPGTPDRGVLILALPRTGTEPSALDRFLKGRMPGQTAEILFLYTGDRRDKAAETCVSIYGQKGGVHARRIRL